MKTKKEKKLEPGFTVPDMVRWNNWHREKEPNDMVPSVSFCG